MKKRKRKRQPTIPPLTKMLRKAYGDALAQGDLVKEAHDVFWDIGPGQRPHVVRQHFLQVARSEGINVEISIVNKGRSLLIAYPPEDERRIESVIAEALESL